MLSSCSLLNIPENTFLTVLHDCSIYTKENTNKCSSLGLLIVVLRILLSFLGVLACKAKEHA